jgi:enoyl-CoA hydratase
MAFETITMEKRDGAAWVRLSREKHMNSLNFAMVSELGTALEDVTSDKGVRSVVLTGSGRAFCAGADLKEVLGGIEAGGDAKRDFLAEVGKLFAAVRGLPKPVIGGLNGITMAGGLELAMCCDFLVASQSATIGDAHSNFGVFPGAGGAAVLPSRIGIANAKYLLFSGDALPAERLREMGLVQEIVADNELDVRLAEIASALAAKSPLVLRRMKEVADASLEMSQTGALKLELETLRNHLRSDDLREGLQAFGEKRKPVFTGR